MEQARSGTNAPDAPANRSIHITNPAFHMSIRAMRMTCQAVDMPDTPALRVSLPESFWNSSSWAVLYHPGLRASQRRS
jgi:hypothetical protein